MIAGAVVLSAERIVHRFGRGETEHVALHGVNLDARAGEILLLMGPSGSGKTTLLQIMGCLLRPSEGSVTFQGENVAAYSAAARDALRRRHFGFVFQANNLFPTLTTTENVMVALDLLGVRGAAARREAHALLESVGLGDRLDALPTQLSGGQRQRVGIARALAGEPTVLLADEPTAALDAHSGHRVMALMRKLAREDNRAVVIVTHDGRITQSADRIARLEDGRIIGKLRAASETQA